MKNGKKVSIPSEFKKQSGDFYRMSLEANSPSYIEVFDNDSPIYQELKPLEQNFSDKTLHSIGGMKVISRVKDLRTGRQIALAEMKKKSDVSSEEVEQFLREARITATLEHPNIVPIYDMGLNQSGKPFFTMKFMQDESLKKVIRELIKVNPLYVRQYPLTILLDIFLKVCEAVAYAHSRGVIHLDIKPDNIMIGQYGEVYICDWGLAKVIQSAQDVNSFEVPLDPSILNGVTLSGVVKGTPGFMAPEQISEKFGEKSVQTDIYALGALLYNILSLKRPFDGMDAEATINATISNRPLPPSRVSLKPVPEALDAICMKAMTSAQKKRYVSVNTLINDIRSYQNGFAVKAEEVNFAKSFALFYKRNKILNSLILVTTILGITLTTVFMRKLTNAEKIAENSLLDKSRQLSDVRQRALVQIDKLKLENYDFKQALINERGVINGFVKNRTLDRRVPLITNLSAKYPHNIFNPHFSLNVPLENSPPGTKEFGLNLVETDIFHTGVLLPEKFTVAFWVKLPKVLKDNRVQLFTDNGGDNEVNFQVRENGAVRFNTWQNRINFLQTEPEVVAPGTWTHFAIVHRGKDNGMELYVNGKLLEKSVPDFSVSWGWLKLKDFGCIVDELRIWKTPLSAEDINFHKNNSDVVSDNMIGWFRFPKESKDFLEERVTGLSIKNEAYQKKLKHVNVETPQCLTGYGITISPGEKFDTGVDLPGSFTISLWAKMPENITNRSLRIVTDGGGLDEVDFYINGAGGLRFNTYSDDPNQIVTATGLLKPSEWTHITIIHKGGLRNMELFVNGKLVGWTHTNFGRNPWGRLKISDFDGIIAELRVWKGALSFEEVEKNVNSLEPKKENLIKWFKFDE